jgi:hypothetical protein
MNKLQRIALTIPFCFALMSPVSITAHGQDRDGKAQRYYDEEHKDYHEWNANEQRYWHEYWVAEHRPYVDWDRATDKQRRAYWRWRHEHEHDRDRDHDRDDHR